MSAMRQFNSVLVWNRAL